jgi:hypothetical protein
MLSNYKQCYFINIHVAYWQNAHHCHGGLQEACGKWAVLYHVIVRWVHVFQGGRESSEHKLGAVQRIAAADEVHIACVSTLPGTNWKWTCAVLLSEIGIALSIIHRILNENLKMQEICAQWASHGLTGIHVATYGNCQTAFQSLWTWGWSLTSLDHFSESDMPMRIKLSWRESWSESNHQGSPCPQKCRQEQVQQKVVFTVAYSLLGYFPTHAVHLGTTGDAVYYRYVFKH